MTAASFWLLRHYVGGGNPSIVCEEEKNATERAVSFDAATNAGVRERQKKSDGCERVGILTTESLKNPSYRFAKVRYQMFRLLLCLNK